MTTLFTIGYQGQSIDSFLELLLAHGVAHVLDVRHRPYSRKPDFSKKRLSAHLATVGLGYTHLADLGTPKALRDEVRLSHDYGAFFAAMEPLIAAQPAALLCFEASHAECHRLTVATALARRAAGELEIVHLG